MLKRLVIALCALPLAGCIPWSVNEPYFFKPQPMSQKAADASEIRFSEQDKITGPYTSERPPTMNGRLPAKITHEMVMLGSERIAISRVKAANGADNEPLIVYCPGNASDQFHSALYYTDKVLPWGEILMFDYPGYGDSTGQPLAKSFTSVRKDMGPWLDKLAHGRPLVFWGHSIGGLICPSIVAESHEADAVILETTGPSFAAVAEDRKPWFAPFIRTHVIDDLKPYDTAELLKNFKGPILVLGAGKDTTLPVRLARSLSEALKAGGLKVEYREYATAGHHTAALNPQFGTDAEGFFARVTDANH